MRCSNHCFTRTNTQRRCGIGMSVFRFAPVGDDHAYCISPGVSVPGMAVDVLQQIIGEANALAKDPMSNV